MKGVGADRICRPTIKNASSARVRNGDKMTLTEKICHRTYGGSATSTYSLHSIYLTAYNPSNYYVFFLDRRVDSDIRPDVFCTLRFSRARPNRLEKYRRRSNQEGDYAWTKRAGERSLSDSPFASKSAGRRPQTIRSAEARPRAVRLFWKGDRGRFGVIGVGTVAEALRAETTPLPLFPLLPLDCFYPARLLI